MAARRCQLIPLLHHRPHNTAAAGVEKKKKNMFRKSKHQLQGGLSADTGIAPPSALLQEEKQVEEEEDEEVEEEEVEEEKRQWGKADGLQSPEESTPL